MSITTIVPEPLRLFKLPSVMSRTMVRRLMTLAMVELCRLAFERRVGVGDARVDVTTLGIVMPGADWSSVSNGS